MRASADTSTHAVAYLLAKGLLLCWGIVFLLADFLANDKPLVAKWQGRWMVPVVQTYLVEAGWSEWPDSLLLTDWKHLPYDYAIWPPVAWSPGTQDALNPSAGPFGSQQVASWRHRHWLGTDELGRDVASGILHAVRVDLTVGILATLLALLIGVVLGGLAGFMGDTGWQTSRGNLLTILVAIWPISHLTLGQSMYMLADNAARSPVLFVVQMVGFTILFVSLLGALIWLTGKIRVSWWQHPVSIPFDVIIQRLIEVTVSVPVIFLIILFLSIAQGGSLVWLVFVIGLTRWTGIARLVRAEMLREKALPYIESAKAMGYSGWYSWWRHALPAARGPIAVAAAFGMANAIMITALLSFLGLGLPPDVPTWGGLLNLARENTGDWWLAVFPGTALFLTLLSLNIVGDHISKQEDSKGKT